MTTQTESPSLINFSDNFWESLEKNGITILIERMRGAKQTCERFKHAYEARALLEEEYGKTLLQIAQKQKTSSTENGSSKIAMDTMQTQFQSVAESHLHLSNLLRENVAVPLSKLLNKQRVLRKELQTSIQKLYNNRQIQVHFVRRAHKRHNLEIEKANLLVQQQTSEKDKRATFKTAEITIDKLKKVYDEALNDLNKIVEDWNTEWKNTCESFEKLEQERLEFFKSNLSNCVNLMIGCLEGEIQACEKVNAEAVKINVVQDLVNFVKKNKSCDIIPTPMEYIKLHAYHEANQDRGDLRHTHNAIKDTIDNEDHSESEDRVHVHINRKRSSTVSSMVSDGKPMERKIPEQTHVDISRKPVSTADTAAIAPVTAAVKEKPPVMMVGVMEVYASGDEDNSDSEEYEYVTETESEEEEEEEVVVEDLVVKDNIKKDETASLETVKTVPKEVIQVVEEPKVEHDEEEEEEEQTADEGQVEEEEEEQEEIVAPAEAPVKPKRQEKRQSAVPQDEKVDRLMSAYQQEIQKERTGNTPPQQQPSMLLRKNNSGFNPKRRVSFVETGPIHPVSEQATIVSNKPVHSAKAIDPTTSLNTLNRLNPSYSTSSNNNMDPEDDDDCHRDSEDAALELDDMLRELDSKRIIRDGSDESVRYRHQPDIKPTASISSPSLLQKQQQRRINIPSSQYFPNQQPQSRRMSTIETTSSYSRQPSFNTMNSSNSYMDIYDPFNSLSSKETGGSTINSNSTHHISSNNGSANSMRNKTSNSPPSAQMIHDRMLKNNQEQLQQHRRSVSSSSSSTGSIRSVEQPASYRSNKFIQDFYSVGSKTPSPDNAIQKRTGGFIDFAFALYDYEEADEGEISFKEGDLLGIISKSEEDDEQGWWEASLLNRRNQKVIKTGLVPSNFLETASK